MAAGGDTRARVICIGTAYHPEDALHVFQARGWPTFRYPVELEDGAPRWPKRWSAQRIAEKRVELGPAESSRQLDVEVRDDSTATIKLEWIENAIARGVKSTPLSRTNDGRPYLLNVPPAWRVVAGVDLAVSKKTSSDLSAIVVALVHPNGDRELVSVETGRWHGPEIEEHVIDVHRRFACSTIVVESNAAQAYIGHYLARHGVNFTPFTTGSGVRSLQGARLERVATKLANGSWLIPSVDDPRSPTPAVRVRDRESMMLCRDLLHYTPSLHCPDRVAALAFCQYGCEHSEVRAEVGYLDLLSR